MWTYNQTSGDLTHDGIFIGSGYAGCGAGLNNPVLQLVDNVGPIPRGTYCIGPAFTHALAGPITMRLIPDAANFMGGRDGFLMHGDTASMDHTASHGCIVMNHTIRQLVAASPDRNLTVNSQ